jgi:hypothetical protein
VRSGSIATSSARGAAVRTGLEGLGGDQCDEALSGGGRPGVDDLHVAARHGGGEACIAVHDGEFGGGRQDQRLVELTPFDGVEVLAQ